MKRIFIAFISSLLFLAVVAQTSVPYYCGFETEAECQKWSFKKASKVVTGLAIGDAVKSTGVKSLYSSADNGITANYSMTPNGYSSTAFITVTLDAGYHDIYFDYKIFTGADYDDIRCMATLVPTSTNINPFATAIAGENFNKVATAGKIWESNPDREYKVSGWTQQKATFNVATAGDYYLVFLFKQKGISERERYGIKFPERTGVAVDNISINKMPLYDDCQVQLADLKAKNEDTGVRISWSANKKSASYQLVYYKINDDKTLPITPDTISNITTTDHLIPYASTPYGVYTVKVRPECSSVNGAWTEKTPVIIYGPSDYCINYWDFESSNTVCTMGSFGKPFDKIMKLDYGYESRESYHTVHYDTTEYDPVTGYQLKTVPPGHWASTRLGCGSEFGPNDGSIGGPSQRMSAAITYKYRVPDNAELFLLNYAPVLQFAAHHPENAQTQIVIDVLDQFGSLLDSKCLKSKFNSIRLKYDEVAGVADPGWHNFRPPLGQYGASGDESPDEIKWHDWMIMGFNLKAYAGELVQFRISLDPCGASVHFAYIYLVPQCVSASVEGMSCNERASAFEVPEGFNYRWYKQNDRKRKVVCRDRFFTPDPTDTDSYYVDLMNKEDSTCYFTLEAHILPRKPIPAVDLAHKPENCQNNMVLDGYRTSIYEVRDTGLTMVDRAKARVSNYIWNCGELGTFNGEKITCTFPPEGGSFPVTLTCEYGGCSVDTTFTVEVPSIASPIAHISKTICQGDVYTVNKKDYDTEGIYHDTIPNRTIYGCDSILEINLHVIPHTTIDTTVTVTSDQLPYPLRIDGKNHTFTAPKDTTIAVPSRELRKCDSITYNIHLEVIGMLEVELDSLPQICADDPQFTVYYRIDAGFFDTIYVNFDSFTSAAGFDKENVSFIDNGVVVPIPSDTLRPDDYNMDIIFRNDYGIDTLPVPFTVLYPSSIIAQRWNDVLAIKNSGHNGGYNFVAYQWYQNGTPISGSIQSQYYTQNATLDSTAEYTALLTRVDDGKAIFTCPYTPTIFTSGDSYSEQVDVVFNGNTAQVSVPQQAVAALYNSTGSLITTLTLTPPNTNITLPTPHGIYLLRLTFPDGTTQTLKLTF